MIKVKWLVERYNRDRALNYLIKEIKVQGFECTVVKYVPFQTGKYDIYDDNDCVVFYGSLNLARQLQKEKSWIPGVYCNFKNFECITYYSHWGKYLLNQDYIMMPLMEFLRNRKNIYDNFGVVDKDYVFIRPNSGSKTFNGEVYSFEELDVEINTISQYGGLSLDQILIVVSSPKKIYREWRVVVADRKPITASQYKVLDYIQYEKGCDNEVWRLAQEIAKENWQPDKVYVLDICSWLNEKSNKKEYSLLEVNSFSCSGLYQCDISSVVRNISKLAKKEWLEYQDLN